MWRLCFLDRGINDFVQCGGVGNSSRVGTVQKISTVLLDATSQGHHNQQANVLVGAETAGGLCVSFVFRRASQRHHNQPINRCISFMFIKDMKDKEQVAISPSFHQFS